MFARAPRTLSITVVTGLLALAACSTDGPGSPTLAVSPSIDREESRAPGTPPMNLNVRLRGSHDAEGSIRFRQPNDGVMTLFLHTRVEGLAPNHDYYLQRAALALGSGCVDGGWLTLGLGTVVTPIHTNDEGEGRADLFRTLPASLAGAAFDIHFRIIDAASAAEVLQSGCLRYTVNPN